MLSYLRAVRLSCFSMAWSQVLLPFSHLDEDQIGTDYAVHSHAMWQSSSPSHAKFLQLHAIDMQPMHNVVGARFTDVEWVPCCDGPQVRVNFEWVRDSNIHG